MPAPTPAEAKVAVLTTAAVNLTTACTAMNISQTTGSRLIAKDAFPVPVIRMGTRVIVPTEPLRKFLHLDEVTGGDAAETGGAA